MVAAKCCKSLISEGSWTESGGTRRVVWELHGLEPDARFDGGLYRASDQPERGLLQVGALRRPISEGSDADRQSGQGHRPSTDKHHGSLSSDLRKRDLAQR